VKASVSIAVRTDRSLYDARSMAVVDGQRLVAFAVCVDRVDSVAGMGAIRGLPVRG
jgi:hypothetical protein